MDFNFFAISTIFLFFATTNAREYCQPDNGTCWPTEDQIQDLKKSLSAPNDCLTNVPTFLSLDEEGELIINKW